MGGCWLYDEYIDRHGYGKRGGRYVHRLVYEALVGPIPEGLQLDHLCRVRHCYNPAHLEPVTPLENTLRGEPARRTHCPKGHPYDEANTRWAGHGRYCRACNNVAAKAYAARKREAL